MVRPLQLAFGLRSSPFFPPLLPLLPPRSPPTRLGVPPAVAAAPAALGGHPLSPRIRCSLSVSRPITLLFSLFHLLLAECKVAGCPMGSSAVLVGPHPRPVAHPRTTLPRPLRPPRVVQAACIGRGAPPLPPPQPPPPLLPPPKALRSRYERRWVGSSGISGGRRSISTTSVLVHSPNFHSWPLSQPLGVHRVFGVSRCLVLRIPQVGREVVSGSGAGPLQ